MINRLAGVVCLLAPGLWAQSYTISTVAGGGLPPLPAPALSTSIGNSFGVAADLAGNFYVADDILNVVYKINPSGVIAVVAGTGHVGYSGDGGPAVSAQLSNPVGLALDAGGNLYIADAGNSRIREVLTSGVIMTVAGNGEFDYFGDGGPATLSALSEPYRVALDTSGNIFIADTFNLVVREVSGGTITTFAGNHTMGYSGDGGRATQAAFNFPYSVALDPSGNVYIADTYNLVVRRVSTGGIISTYAGDGGCCDYGDGGPAVDAGIGTPFSIAVDAAANLYIADSGSARVLEVSPAGIITTFAGDGDPGYSGDGGAATSAELNSPEGVGTGPNGTVYILDSDNYYVRQVSSSHIITTIAGNGSANYFGDGGQAASALLGRPVGVAVASDGTLYVSDSGNNRLRSISGNGVIVTIAGNGVGGYSGDNGPQHSKSSAFHKAWGSTRRETLISLILTIKWLPKSLRAVL